MRRLVPAAAALFMLLSLIGCGAPTPAVAPSPPVVTAPAAPSVVAPSVAAPPVAAEAAKTWVMPNLVGANLREAQNRIQTLASYGIAVSLSHDATGKGRQQLVDNNWSAMRSDG